MRAALGATLRRGWSRPWLRRTTLTLVAGGVLVASVGWTLRQPFLHRRILRQLDALCREQTGLGLRVDDLELHPLQGRVRLRGIAFGEGLLQVDAVELRVKLGSLLGNRPVVHYVAIEGPRISLDAQRLAALRLKAADPRKPPLDWEVQRLELRRGQLRLAEAAWGLPDAWAEFTLQAHSLGPRRLLMDLQVPRLGAAFSDRALTGHAEIRGSLGPELLQVRGAKVQLGTTEFAAQGEVDLNRKALASQLKVKLELSDLEGILGLPRLGNGQVVLAAKLGGSLSAPIWTAEVGGESLRLAALEGQPGQLRLRAEGQQGRIRLEHLNWKTEDGAIEAEGAWTQANGAQFRFRLPTVGLAPLARPLHMPRFRSMAARGEGLLGWKGRTPEDLRHLDGHLSLAFQDEGRPAGSLLADLKQGHLRLGSLELQVPELVVTGSGDIGLGRKGLRAIEAEGRVHTDAAEVARSLKAWGITDLDMSGRVEAQAKVAWTGIEGFSLTGMVEVASPRWHQAHAERVRSRVGIQRSELQLREIEVEKEGGDAHGELWLSWAKLPKGHDQIDFCFRARDLPIREGLGATDLSHLDITGKASGWVRARGPYDRMQMDGTALAKEALVYGVQIPVFSSEFSWDLERNRMGIRELRLVAQEAQLHREDTLFTGELDLGGQAEFDFERMRFRGRLDGSLDSRTLGMPGPRIQAQVKARFDGDLARDFGPWALPEGEVALSKGRVFLEDQSLEGLRADLQMGEGLLDLRVGLQAFQAPLAQLRLMTEGTGLIGALDVQVDPTTANTEHLAARLTRDLLKDGQLAFQAEGGWSEAGWDWRGRLESLSGQFKGFQLTQPRASELRADGQGVEFDLHLEGQNSQGNGAGRGASLQATGQLPFSQQDPLRVRLQGEADLTDLKNVVDHILDLDAFSVLYQIKAAGTATLDVTAGGTFQDPRLDGEMKLRGGRISTATRPQSLEDVSLDLRFQGQELFVSEDRPLSGRLAQGDLKAWGRSRWKLDGVGEYEFHAKVEDFQLRDLPEGFELQGSVDATLSGTGTGRGLLKGGLTARRMSYRAELNLNDFILNSTLKGASGLTALDPDDLLSRIDLDLDLKLLQPWKFETNLLKLEGQPYGGFKVQGTLAKPGLWGRMEFVPGGLITNLLPAGDIKVERGFISFSDPRAFNPFLNVEGQINISPYLVNLNIRGTIDALDLRPTSTPSLRQDEIIAIMLDPGMVDSVGAGATNTQNSVNAGLAQTTSNLITTLALANLQEGLRKTLNLDRVSFVFRPGGSGNSESTVSVGKSLELFGRRMPVVISRRTVGEVSTNSLQVEWRLGNLVLQLGASQTAPEAAGIAGEIRHTWSPK